MVLRKLPKLLRIPGQIPKIASFSSHTYFHQSVETISLRRQTKKFTLPVIYLIAKEQCKIWTVLMKCDGQNR